MSDLQSYTSGSTHAPLLNITIGEQFDLTAAKFPDHDALIVRHQNIRLSYAQLHQAVEKAARAFLAIGVSKGDRVGIWSPNCAEWAITQFATAKIGAILVNINPAYRTHELEYALNQSETKYLVLASHFKSSDYIDMLYSLAPEMRNSALDQLDANKLPHLKGAIQLSTQEQPGFWRWSDFLAQADHTPVEQLRQLESELSVHDPINIQYTSGTTGFPKGAALSHHNILNNGFFVAESMKFTEHDRLVIPVPLYHCFGMVMGNLGCISHGAAMIYPDEGFDPESVLQAVAEEQATALFGVPTMFIAEMEHPNFNQYDLSSLRTGIMAGSICPAEVMKAVNNLMHMHEVQIAYGMTETSPVSTQTAADAPFDKRVTTVGRTQPHLESQIINPATGKVVARGEVGELCTRGYSVMLKYWNNPEATKEAIDAQSWMHTGDLASMDAEGYIQIVGRIKDMVIRGGENIYPKEIEEFLYTHPAISDVQVTGVPDPQYGEELIAWIKLAPHVDNLSEEQLRSFCQGTISHFKIPRYFKFVDSFPMTVTGKIQKFKMREISIAELGLDQRLDEKS